jgi:hypothetical protein
MWPPRRALLRRHLAGAFGAEAYLRMISTSTRCSKCDVTGAYVRPDWSPRQQAPCVIAIAAIDDDGRPPHGLLIDRVAMCQ